MSKKLARVVAVSIVFSISCFYHAYAATDALITDNSSVTPPISKPSITIPAAPEFDVKSYVLLDADSGQVIAEKNANEKHAPASLTKLMTLYLTANALRNGKIHLNDQVVVSEKAWRTGGSRMFIKVGSSVSIQDLIKGVAIASGNDATVALAEHLAGSESAFVDIMNKTTRDLKMDNTHFVDSSGFMDKDNCSTAYDLAMLSMAWIKDFPEYYPWFKDKWISYNNIKQPNRNRLLWRDPSVDGFKTGHTDAAGYCLIASAKRSVMRLIAVVMGAKSDAVRTRCSMALLDYGFRFFATHKLFTANTKVTTVKVFLGKKKVLDLGLHRDFYVTLPKEQYSGIKVKAELRKFYEAPIVKGENCGTLNILLDNKVIATMPLVALQDDPRASFIFAIFDYIKMLFCKT